MSKKIFSISSYDPYHPKAKALLDDFKKQTVENYQKCFPKIPIESFKGCFDYVGTCEGANYHHLFYGDDLIGYFGYYHADENRMVINELYIEEKYMTKKNMNEVLSESELLEVLGHEFVCISRKNKFYKKQLVYNILKCEYYFKDIKLPKYSCGKRECYDFILKNHKIELYPITEVQKIKQSNTMKKMIYDGVFYPVNNRKHHNKYEIDGFKLKSTWEVIFYCHLKYNDKTVEYESVVIKYNDNRNYFVDFYLPNDNILYEVKPTCELINDTIISKHEAAENYAKVNNILFNVITEYDIFKIIKNNNFLYDYIESQDLSYKDKVLKSYKNFMKEA